MKFRYGTLIARVFGVPAAHPVLTLVVTAAVLALAAWGAARIEPVASLQAMVSDREPAARALGRITSDFPAVDALLVVATVPDAVDSAAEVEAMLRRFATEFESAVLAAPDAAELCREINTGESSYVRDFIENVLVPNGLYYVDDDSLDEVAHRLSREGIALRIRENESAIAAPGVGGKVAARLIAADPLRLNDLLAGRLAGNGPTRPANVAGDLTRSRDGRSLLIRITGVRPAGDLQFCGTFTERIDRIARDSNPDDLTIELAGSYAIAAAAEKSIRGDMIRSIALSILMLQALFFLVYRDPFSFVRAVLPVVAGIVAAFGLYSMFSLRLTPITAVIGGVLAGIGIDYCIHFLSHHAGLISSGRSRFDAIAGSLAEVGPAMTAACGTSVLGFLAISRSNVAALRDFAWLGAMGLAGALLAAFVLLPVLLMLRRDGAKARHNRPLRIDIEPLVRRVCVHRKGPFIGALALMAIAVGVLSFGSGRSSWLEDDLTVMHPRPNAPLAAQRRIAERFDVSPEALIVLLESDGPDGLVSLSHRVASRLAGEGPRRAGVAGTYGLADLLPDPDGIPARRAMIEALDADRILQDFDAALQRSIFDPAAYEAYRAFLRRLLTESAPPGIAGLGEYPGLAAAFLATPRPDSAGSDSIGVVRGAAALTYVHLARPPETRDHRDAVIRAIRQALDDVAGATLTGLSVIAGDTEHGIRRELSRLLGVAAGAVAIWLLLFFRSIRAAALALLPAAFGTLCLLAVMRLTGTKLNMINLIALPLLVGIGVDDGIFLVSIARARRRDRGDVAQGLSAACHAVMMTSVTTTLTFGTLAFTSTPAIQSLGRIMAVGVTASFAGAVFLLVPILSRRTAGE